MTRSLLAPALIAPILLFGLLGMPLTTIGAASMAVVLLTWVLAHDQRDIEIGATLLGSLNLGTFDKMPRDLSVYLAGVGFGVQPATDWYTAIINGQRVLVLESVEIK